MMDGQSVRLMCPYCDAFVVTFPRNEPPAPDIIEAVCGAHLISEHRALLEAAPVRVG